MFSEAGYKHSQKGLLTIPAVMSNKAKTSLCKLGQLYTTCKNPILEDKAGWTFVTAASSCMSVGCKLLGLGVESEWVNNGVWLTNVQGSSVQHCWNSHRGVVQTKVKLFAYGKLAHLNHRRWHTSRKCHKRPECFQCLI